MNAWKVIVSTLVIFIAGVVTGGLLVTNTFRVLRGDSAVAMNRNGFAPVNPGNPNNVNNPNNPNNPANPWQFRDRELLRRMDRELELTPEQHARIEHIMSVSADRTKNLWKPIAPLMAKETQLTRAEIRDELTPEQRKKFGGFAKARPGLDKRRNATNAPQSGSLTNAISTNTAPQP